MQSTGTPHGTNSHIRTANILANSFAALNNTNNFLRHNRTCATSYNNNNNSTANIFANIAAGYDNPNLDSRTCAISFNDNNNSPVNILTDSTASYINPDHSRLTSLPSD